MPRCKSCGKFGLFLKLDDGYCNSCVLRKKNNKIQKEQMVYEDSIVQNKDDFIGEKEFVEDCDKPIENDINKDAEQLDRLNEALSNYWAIKDYNSIIAVYEDVFSETINWNALTHKLKLSELYMKVDRLDDSWKLLNSLICEYPDELARIRGCQFRQLKKEKKYSVALRMCYMHSFDKICQTRSNYETYGSEIYSKKEIYEFISSDIEDFTKTALTLAKKVGIPTECICDLETVFVYCFANRLSEGIAVEKYNEWYRKIEVMMDYEREKS